MKPSEPVRRPCVAIALLLLAGLGVYPSSAAGQAALTAEARAEVVRSVGEALAGGYVLEEQGVVMRAALEAGLAEGRYDQLVRPEALARALTDELQALGHDRHLLVRAPDPRRGPRAAERERLPAPDLGPEGNQGFARVEVIGGNVGLLDLREFSRAPRAVRCADAAMVLLDQVDALIVDVGRNRGGAAPVIQRLCAYLFARPTRLYVAESREWEGVRETWTDAVVPGRVRPDLPVFVVTSHDTFSAAEAFAFGLKVTGRATLVGERTAGGGHFGRPRELAHGFSMFLPVGRAYDPQTGEGWEGVGVAPDVEVPLARAFREAHALAREAAAEHRKMRVEVLAPALADLVAAGERLGAGDAAGARELAGLALAGVLAAGAQDADGLVGMARRVGGDDGELTGLLLAAVVDVAPRSVSALVALAENELERGLADVARGHLRRAAALDPTSRRVSELLESIDEEDHETSGEERR